MPAEPVVRPQDLEDLQEYCRQLLTELTSKDQLIAKLTHELALFRRYLYGRRSEKLEGDPAQLLLEFASWLTAMNAATPAEPAPAEAPSPAGRPRRGHGRRPLPGWLPRRRVQHALPAEQCACTKCGARLVQIGAETSEQLDYQPASLFVTEHVRFKYARPAQSSSSRRRCRPSRSTRGAPAQDSSPR